MSIRNAEGKTGHDKDGRVGNRKSLSIQRPTGNRHGSPLKLGQGPVHALDEFFIVGLIRFVPAETFAGLFINLLGRDLSCWKCVQNEQEKTKRLFLEMATKPKSFYYSQCWHTQLHSAAFFPLKKRREGSRETHTYSKPVTRRGQTGCAGRAMRVNRLCRLDKRGLWSARIVIFGAFQDCCIHRPDLGQDCEERFEQ